MSSDTYLRNQPFQQEKMYVTILFLISYPHKQYDIHLLLLENILNYLMHLDILESHQKLLVFFQEL